MASKITAKMEKYCQFRAQGMNQADSYRGSYSCEKMKDSTIIRKAHDLEHHEGVKARIAELNAAIANEVVSRQVATAEEVLETASQILRACSQMIPLTDGSGNQVMGLNDKGELVPAYAPVDGKTAMLAADKFMRHYGQYAADNNQRNQHAVLQALAQLPEDKKTLIMERLYALTGRSPGKTIPGVAERH